MKWLFSIVLITLVLALAISAAGCLGSSSSDVPFDVPSDTPPHDVVQTEDQSFSDDHGKVVQLVYWVRSTPEPSLLNESQRLAIGKSVIANVVADRAITEITVFLLDGGYSVGGGACASVTWAPDGSFGNAQDVDPGDYSKNTFSTQKNPGFCGSD